MDRQPPLKLPPDVLSAQPVEATGAGHNSPECATCARPNNSHSFYRLKVL
jgi:hypothetical protein